MALSRRERQGILLKLIPHSSPKFAPLRPIDEAVRAIKKLYDANEAFRQVNSRRPDSEDEEDAGEETRSLIYIADMKIRRSSATILFVYGDDDGADPAFLNLRSRRRRVVRRGDNEANAFSAHMVVAMPQAGGAPVPCPAVLERVPNLGRTRIVSFLEHLLRKDMERRTDLIFTHPETQKPTPYRLSMGSGLHASAKLVEDVAQSHISAIELVNHRPESDLDEPPYLRTESRVLKLKVDESRIDGDRLGIIQRLIARARGSGYDTVHVIMRKAVTGQQISARFATEVTDAADAIYARVEMLDGFQGDLDQCYEEIHDPIAERLEVILNDTARWQ